MPASIHRGQPAALSRSSVVLIGVCLLLAGCGESDAERAAAAQREAIRRVFAVDAALAKPRGRGVKDHKSTADAAAAVTQYAAALSALDLSGLPDDVRAAYVDHAAAWRSMGELITHYSGVTGALRASFEDVTARGAAAEKAINDTWNEVKRRAKAHGVDDVPN